MIPRIVTRTPANYALFKRLFSSQELAYSEKRAIGFSREQMFDVVADVGQYHLFIPWCRRSDILEKHENSRIAELEIGFPPLLESYRSRITLLRPSVVHSVVIGDSIFNTLETTFRFAKGEPDNELSCVLHYDLVFEFKSALHSGMAHLFFDRVVKTMVEAFLRRAEQLHGKPSTPHASPEVLRYKK
ncbi:hypothetical protein RB195_010717 [Necator americanus]|uniref:Polyketide cyclase/dehydrase n=2 Tax=Necator americanus TaxID=51031 RepID=W2SZH9_NECAM|nr:polyketide cyclase/dehydrase [Necator americanus]ETN74386.1 polyketide cyclase/dehydrase [Necator americanus]